MPDKNKDNDLNLTRPLTFPSREAWREYVFNKMENVNFRLDIRISQGLQIEPEDLWGLRN